VDLLADEVGCPITIGRGMQVARPLALLRTTIEHARTYPFAQLRGRPGRGLRRRCRPARRPTLRHLARDLSADYRAADPVRAVLDIIDGA
jgi:hypothetical protein